MGESMDHTLVKINQLSVYGMTVQENPFAEVPIFNASVVFQMDHDVFQLKTGCSLSFSGK